LHGRMAVAAIDAIFAHVMLMAEGNRLLDGIVLRRIGARVDAVDDKCGDSGSERSHQGESKQQREASREDLRHGVAPSVDARAIFGPSQSSIARRDSRGMRRATVAARDDERRPRVIGPRYKTYKADKSYRYFMGTAGADARGPRSAAAADPGRLRRAGR